MDTDIALAALASGRTVLVGAECRRGVHDAPPGCAWKTLPREVCLDPRLLYNCTVPRFGVELPLTPFAQKMSEVLKDRKRYKTGERPRRTGYRPYRNRAIIYTLMETGMRRAAVTHLDLTQADLAGRRLTVVEKGGATHTYQISG